MPRRASLGSWQYFSCTALVLIFMSLRASTCRRARAQAVCPGARRPPTQATPCLRQSQITHGSPTVLPPPALPYGKNRAEHRHLLKETGILDSLFRFCGTRWGLTVVLTVIVSRTHHFADSKPHQMRSVKITRPEAQFFDFASSQRVSVSTSHVRSIARRSGAGARYIVRQGSSRPSWGCCTSARARYALVTHVAAGT